MQLCETNIELMYVASETVVDRYRATANRFYSNSPMVKLKSQISGAAVTCSNVNSSIDRQNRK